ncbi:nuclear envelope protein-like protein Cut8 [Ascodesmis nigricans]|uniref:Tethering factor for nuclear proteasome STS1 n=1 Tax=Ascodesmis nigricans TaxID=341454 RepID=A0A4S2MV46_9PEZI|nr:nuclear envelope protein-like protein Cut8 [Ascodesmis nigricans]
MSALMNPQPFPWLTFPRHSPSRLTSAAGRKRKNEDDHHARASSEESDSMDHNMDERPVARAHKRKRNALQGRPLPLARKLETIDPTQLINIIKTLSERHPELTQEMSELCPNPTAATALAKLSEYERNYKEAFPFGGNQAGDYAYNRVKPALMQMLDALSDFTTAFLPPAESQASISLGFLDAATEMIHRLPTWCNPLHNMSKNTAYEEITKAWILVLQEAAKRGAGIQIHHGGWDIKLAKHNEQSQGRMDAAVMQMRNVVGWASESSYTTKPSPRQAGFGFGFGMHSGVGVSVRGL